MCLLQITHCSAQKTIYFGVRDENPMDDGRADWIVDIVSVLRLCVLSMFPPFCYAILPERGIDESERRLMAGYAALRVERYKFVMLYCDLRAPTDLNEEAFLVFYSDETCRQEHSRITIKAKSDLAEQIGIQCSLFSIDDFWLAVRTSLERRAWIRALTNVQIRLQTGSYAANMPFDAVRMEMATHLDHLDQVAAEFPAPTNLIPSIRADQKTKSGGPKPDDIIL